MKKIKTICVLLILVCACSIPTFAQTTLTTTSKTVTTQVGSPSGSNGGGVVPPATGGYGKALFDTFGITMSGFDDTHLQWTWEKLNEINNPSFTSLLNGSAVEATTGLSEQIGCFNGTSLRLGQYTPEAFFKFIIIHEFGHIIQNCQPRIKSRSIEHENSYASEGPISYYSKNTELCTGLSNHLQEDYADTMAYYFNPDAGLSSGPSKCPGIIANPPNPYINGGFTEHRAVPAGL